MKSTIVMLRIGPLLVLNQCVRKKTTRCIYFSPGKMLFLAKGLGVSFLSCVVNEHRFDLTVQDIS